MSKFFGNRLFRAHLFFAPDPDPAGGGGGGKNDPPAPDQGKLISDLQASNKALMDRLEKLEKGGKNDPPNPDQEDLSAKAERERKAKEKEAGDSKALERAMKFAIQAPDWYKTHKALLPKSIESIFEQAEKENYGGAIAKEGAIKAAIVQEFFSQQSNLDLLTEFQKNALEDFRKLTNTVKQEKGAAIFDSIFEPTFGMVMKIKKAEQVSKGLGDPDDKQAGLKEKMIAASRKQYMREKK